MGSFIVIGNRESNSLSSIIFESIEEDDEYLNTYYVKNVSYDFYNNLIDTFEMIKPNE